MHILVMLCVVCMQFASSRLYGDRPRSLLIASLLMLYVFGVGQVEMLHSRLGASLYI